ncbi:MAG: TIGR02444 family protein [Chromatiales bacterium]|nr:TIGR02444 family protein [Chromatiales bacterium]
MTSNDPRTADPDAPALWPWSLATYGRAGFSAAALELQDRHGLDVNILLYCLWAGLVHRALLGEDGVRAALVATRAWQAEVVLPLRAARRWLKGRVHPESELAAALRRRVADAELDAERGEQALLAALALPAERAADPLAAAAVNLRAYARAAGLGPAADGTLGRALSLAAGCDDGEAGRRLAEER